MFEGFANWISGGAIDDWKSRALAAEKRVTEFGGLVDKVEHQQNALHQKLTGCATAVAACREIVDMVTPGANGTVRKMGKRAQTALDALPRLQTAEKTFGKALPVRIDPADSIQREEPVEEEPDDCDSDACSGDDEPKGGKKGGGKR